MADIEFTCAACGTVTHLSEYVSPEAAVCRACGKKLNHPRAPVPATPAARPAAQPAARPAAPVPPVRPAPAAASKNLFPPPVDATAQALVRKRQDRMRKRRRIIAWTPSSRTILIAYIAITAVLCLFRYVILSDSDREGFRNIGLMCLLVGHLTVIVDAFADNTMHGLLCLFVPFYSLFYLFSQCDSWVLRLGIGVLLLPFGPDAAIEAWKLAQGFMTWVENTPISAT